MKNTAFRAWSSSSLKRTFRTTLLTVLATSCAVFAVYFAFHGSVKLAIAQEASAPPEPPGPPATVSNGIVQLGVNPEGNLGAPGGKPSPSAGTDIVGLRFSATGNETISSGDTQESWGVADAASGTHGHADESDFYFVGKANATATEFSTTDETARSVVGVTANGTAPAPTFEVTHEYRPSPFSPNLYEALVTIENTSLNPAGDVRYRRVVDWDVEPTEFSEYVTIGGDQSLEELLFSSNDGFANPNPLGERTDDGATGFFTDSGPYDQGATFDFGFGPLGPGERKTFKLFYGAAANEADSLAALSDVGADVYSLAQPDTEGGPGVGSPNTFALGFLVTNRPPEAVEDLSQTDEDDDVVVDVLDNDTDLNSDALKVIRAEQPENGTVECTEDGQCTYTPDPNFNGQDTFTYTVSDGNGGEATGTVRVTVRPVNDQPAAQDDSAETEVNRPVAIEVLANDSDPDGDALSVSASTPGADGGVQCELNGRCTYTPDEDFAGEDSFTYTASDGKGGTATASVQVSVSEPGDANPPDTSITSGPGGPTNNASPSFAFAGSDNATAVGVLVYSHKLDGGAWSPYSSATTATLSGVAQGDHTFYVRARDAAGNEDQSPAERSFTVDTASPTVAGRLPSPGQTGVPRNANVVVTFSEAMDAASVTGSTVTLTKQGASALVAAAVTYDTASKKATLDPSDASGLDSNATYTVSVRGGSAGVKDSAGNALVQESAWTFTTADTVAPNPPTLDLVASSDSGVSSTDNLTNDATPTLSGTAEAGSTVTVYDGASQIGSAQANASGSWTYTPGTALSDGTHPLTAKATDAANNTSSESQTLTLTVDTVAPAVVSMTPPSGSNTSPVSTNVTATFSEAVDSASVNTGTFTLVRSGTTTVLSAAVSYNAATRTAILDPTSSLAAGAAYVATVKGGQAGAKDLAGNALASDRTNTFSTNSAPVVTNFSPAQGASITDRTPVLRATVRDAQTNLAKGNIQLLVNGTARTGFTYDTSTDRLAFTPASNLPLGKNTVKVIATDAQGLRTSKSWSFTVK